MQVHEIFRIELALHRALIIVVNTNADAWSVAMQLGGQVSAITHLGDRGDKWDLLEASASHLCSAASALDTCTPAAQARPCACDGADCTAGRRQQYWTGYLYRHPAWRPDAQLCTGSA